MEWNVCFVFTVIEPIFVFVISYLAYLTPDVNFTSLMEWNVCFIFTVIEPIFVFVMSYLAYLTAELFHFSGIMR